MVIHAPSHAGGMGGRSRNTPTGLEYIWDDYNINHQNNTGRTLEAAVILRPTTSNYHSNNNDHNNNDHNNNFRSDPHHHSHHRQFNHSRSCAQGNRWAETEATRLFRAQSWQFDQGAREYIKRNCPTSREIIAVTN